MYFISAAVILLASLVVYDKNELGNYLLLFGKNAL